MNEIQDLRTAFDTYTDQLDLIISSEKRWPKAVPLGVDTRNPECWAYVYSDKSGVTTSVAEEAISVCTDVANEFGIKLPETAFVGTKNKTFILVRHVPRFSSFAGSRRREDMSLVKDFSSRYLSVAPKQDPFIVGTYNEKGFGRSYESEEEREDRVTKWADWATKSMVAELLGEKFDQEAPRTPEKPVYLIGIGKIAIVA